MKVAFVYDAGNFDGSIGGAELTMGEFIEAGPWDEHEQHGSPEDADVVVVGNCFTFGADLIEKLEGKRVIRYFNDMDPHSDSVLRDWLLENATLIFTSPLHIGRFPHEIPDSAPTKLIPPALDLGRFGLGQSKREGWCSVGSWANQGKGQQNLKEWSDYHEPVDVYGDGAFVPHGPNLNNKGAVAQEQLPEVLNGYQGFVHLPTAVEPFGRGVVEAWASGCELVVNKLVGSTFWIDSDPAKLESAGEDFWALVLG